MPTTRGGRANQSSNELLFLFGRVGTSDSAFGVDARFVGEHDVELRRPDQTNARTRNARVADALAVLAEDYERRAFVGLHDELRRHSLVHHVGDGSADRAQAIPNWLFDRDDAQLLGTDGEGDTVTRADVAIGRVDDEAVARRRRELQPVAGAAHDPGLDDVRRPDEPGDEAGRRPFVDVLGVADLLDVTER